MIVYIHGEKQVRQSSFLLSVSPARHLEGQEMPAEWVSDKNEPIDLFVDFKFGRAEVPSNLGKYLIDHGLAFRSKLIIPDGVKAA